jgi:hypothetical protein
MDERKVDGCRDALQHILRADFKTSNGMAEQTTHRRPVGKQIYEFCIDVSVHSKDA